MGTLWLIVTSPFRLIGWVAALLGRLVGVVLGFTLMVVGVALCAANIFIVLGLPLFIVGLILALKALQ